jgi:hypothetical protein
VEARCQEVARGAAASQPRLASGEENGAANGQDSAPDEIEAASAGGMLQVCVSHSAFIEESHQTEDFGEPVLVWMEPHETVGDLQGRCANESIATACACMHGMNCGCGAWKALTAAERNSCTSLLFCLLCCVHFLLSCCEAFENC